MLGFACATADVAWNDMDPGADDLLNLDVKYGNMLISVFKSKF